MINDSINQFEADADLIHQIVNGDSTAVVTTGGGPVRSVAKLIADNQAAINAAAWLFQQAGSGSVVGPAATTLGITVTPEQFQAKGNTSTFDDSVGIQAAINAVQLAGGGTVQFDGRKIYYLSHFIVFDPVTTSLVGNGAILDYKNMALTDPTTVTELCPDPTFSKPSAWMAGTLTPRGTEFTIGNGQATRAVSTSLYADFGALVPAIQANQTYQFTAVVTAMVSEGNQNYLTIGLRSGIGSPAGDGIGYGSGASMTLTAVGTYSFTLTAPSDTASMGAWLCLQSNNTVTITSLSVKLAPSNYAIRVKSTSAQYGHGRSKLEGFRIQNSSGAAVPLQDGVLFDTPATTYSSRISVSNMEIRTGINRPLVFGNRAYLIHFFNVNAVGYSCAMQFLSGSQDAGENISFYGGTFGSSNGPVVLNGGAELHFFGCSFDYSPQFYQGSGSFEAHGCHFETSLLGAAASQYPFDNQGGDVTLHGGEILINGDNFSGTGVTHDYMFMTRVYNARFFLHDVRGYNWRTTTNQLAGGPGRVVIEGVTGGWNHQIPGIIKRDVNHNIFGDDGSFESGQIKMDAWVVGGDQARTSRYLAQFGAAGANGSGTLSLSSNYARTGSTSLKLAKVTVGVGTSIKAYFAAPVRRNGNIGVEFWYRAPLNLGSGSFVMYAQAWCGQLLGRDSTGVPTYGSTQFFSGPNITVPLDGSSGWQLVSMSNMNADGSVAQDGYAPAWADVVYFLIDLSNAPAGFELYIDDIYGSSF